MFERHTIFINQKYYRAMLKSEFIDRTHIQVTDEEFDHINFMYMESGQGMDKDKFCSDWLKHKDSLLLNEFYKQTNRLKDKMDEAREVVSRLTEFIVDQAEATSSPAMREKAIELLGEKAYIRLKIMKGHTLWAADNEALLRILDGERKHWLATVRG